MAASRTPARRRQRSVRVSVAVVLLSVATAGVLAALPTQSPVVLRVSSVLALAFAAAAMALISIPCVSVWSAGGAVLRRFLVQPAYATAFNIGAAVLLIAATVPILFGGH